MLTHLAADADDVLPAVVTAVDRARAHRHGLSAQPAANAVKAPGKPRTVAAVAAQRAAGGVRCAALALLLAWGSVTPSLLHAQAAGSDHTAHHPQATTAPGEVAAPAADMSQMPPPLPGEAEANRSAPAAEMPPGPALPHASASPSPRAESVSAAASCCGTAGDTLLYPTLANTAELGPEQRAQFERLARDRVTEGISRLRDTLDALGQAVAGGDLQGAQAGAQTVRGALGWLEGGLATFAMLSANEAPNAVATNWFRREMGLPGSAAVVPHGIFGLEPFHYVAMLSLVALLGMLLWIGWQRAQRTRALMAQLARAATPATAASGSLAAPVAGDPSRPQPSALTRGIAGDAATPRVPPAAVVAPAAPVPAEISPTPTNGWSGHLRVAQIFQETPQVKTFRLVDPAGGRLPFVFLPGQFLTVTVAPDGQAVRRSYTIASSPTHRDYCEITVRRESHGIVSGYLHDRVHRGELLSITAPAGRFTFTGEESDSILLVAGGVGITPMMSVVRYLTDRCWPGRIDLVYGCKADNDVIFRDELEYLARRFPNLHMTLVADRAETGAWPHRTGRISKELLVDAVPELVTRRVHICGPGPMMDAVRQMLVDAGVAAQQIRTEAFIGKERAVPAADPAHAPGATAAPAVGGPTGAQPSPAPRPTGGTAVAAAAVVFARSNKRAALGPDETILEAAEKAGVAIDYACRVGTCGTCRVKLLAGSVTMDIEDGLEPTDKANNIVLACQAKSAADVTVDA